MVTVFGIIRIQAVIPLPLIRHAVVVGVPVVGPFFLRVFLQSSAITLIVNKSGETGFAAVIGGGTVSDLLNDPLVMIVKHRPVATDIRKHIFVGIARRLGFDMGFKKRLIDKHIPGHAALISVDVRNGTSLVLTGLVKIPRHDVAVKVVALRAWIIFDLRVKGDRDADSRSGLIVIIHEIYLMSAAVGGSAPPVVNYIVTDIEPAGPLYRILAESSSQAPVSAGAVRQKVVMERADIAADARGVPVLRSRRIIVVPRLVGPQR